MDTSSSVQPQKVRHKSVKSAIVIDIQMEMVVSGRSATCIIYRRYATDDPFPFEFESLMLYVLYFDLA